MRGDVLQADAVLNQRQAELDDLRGRVEYELQVALLDLKAAEQQVEVARSARELATQQMTQAQDRFAAGVVSNIVFGHLAAIVAQYLNPGKSWNYGASLILYFTIVVSPTRSTASM